MSRLNTCVVHEFPIPDREYRAAPQAQWDSPPRRRASPSRVRRRKGSFLTLLALTGLALFLMGFLLGRAGAVGASAAAAGVPPEDSLFSLLPEESSAGTKTVPGGIVTKTEKPDSGDWNLLLVNGEHPLPENFQVPEFTQLVNGHSIDKRAYPDLQRMMDDCRAAGLEPTICSSYRTWAKQEELFERDRKSVV